LRDEIKDIIYEDLGVGKVSDIHIYKAANKKNDNKNDNNVSEKKIKEGIKYREESENGTELENLISLWSLTGSFLEENQVSNGKLSIITQDNQKLQELFQYLKYNENQDTSFIKNVEDLKQNLERIVKGFRAYEQALCAKNNEPTIQQEQNYQGGEGNVIDLIENQSSEQETPEEHLTRIEDQEELQKELTNDPYKRLQDIVEDKINDLKYQDSRFKIGYIAKYIKYFIKQVFYYQNKKITQTNLGQIFQVQQHDISRYEKSLSKKIVKKLLNEMPINHNQFIDETQIIDYTQSSIEQIIEDKAKTDLVNLCQEQKRSLNDIKQNNPEKIINFLNNKIKEDIPEASIYDQHSNPFEFIQNIFY